MGFERGQVVSIRRPKQVTAEDFDPRGGSDARSEEPGHVIVSLALEKLFTHGFPIYSHDAVMNVQQYLRDYVESEVGAIRKAVDDYFYTRCFRDYSGFADTGNVRIGATSPLQIVTTTYTSGTDSFAEYDKTAQRRAKVALDRQEVPNEGRYLALSPAAFGGLLGDTNLFQGYTAPQLAQDFLQRPGVEFKEYYDFMTAPSNAVLSQTGLGAVATFDTNSWDSTIYLKDDYYDDTPLNVLVLNLSVGTHSNAAKGRIVRFTLNSREVFGVILRVPDTATIHIKPYYSDGTEVPAGTTVSSAAVTVPTIPSISVAYHREHLTYASRMLTPPSPGSGATAANASDPSVPIVYQVFSGNYETRRLREENRSTFLCGAYPTDYRKAVLVLSA